jgi:hypothetical protein
VIVGENPKYSQMGFLMSERAYKNGAEKLTEEVLAGEVLGVMLRGMSHVKLLEGGETKKPHFSHRIVYVNGARRQNYFTFNNITFSF